jgi:23S rRNA (uracil1939-C5)-methyltransferase
MTAADEWLRIESLDLEAQGVAHNTEGKVVFVEDALPGEQARVSVRRQKKQWEQAGIVALRHESAERVVPRCRHSASAAAARCSICTSAPRSRPSSGPSRTRSGISARSAPGARVAAARGPAWRYRHRARLSVRYVAKKGAVLVGFP